MGRLHSRMITVLHCLNILSLYMPRLSKWSYIGRGFCSNCVCGFITCSFLTACSPYATDLSVDETYILYILNSCNFPRSPVPLTSIQMFSTSSYQTVLCRVVLQMSPDSSVDIVTPLRVERSGFRFPARARDFYLLLNRPDRLWSLPRLIQWVPGIFLPRVKVPGRVAVHSTSMLMLIGAVSQLLYDFITCTETWFIYFMCTVDLVLMCSSRCRDTLIVANLLCLPQQGPPPQPGQLKFTVAENCDRIKEEFNFLQAQYHS